MKMAKVAQVMFAKEIARAKAKGHTHFAKAVGYPTMRFGSSLERAEKKATADGRRMARSVLGAGASGVGAVMVQSGEL